MINIENKLPAIIFFIVFNVLSYMAGHKDGTNEDFSLGIIFILIIFFMALGAGAYHTYVGYLK